MERQTSQAHLTEQTPGAGRSNTGKWREITDRQRDREPGRQTNRQTDRQFD